MKLNVNQIIVYMGLAVLAICCMTANAASVLASSESAKSNSHLKVKRSPYLRLDELSTKLYLAKNKLGGGLIDPLDIGKRSAPSASSSSHEDNEINLAVVLYDGLLECLDREKCAAALRVLLDNPIIRSN